MTFLRKLLLFLLVILIFTVYFTQLTSFLGIQIKIAQLEKNPSLFLHSTQFSPQLNKSAGHLETYENSNSFRISLPLKYLVLQKNPKLTDSHVFQALNSSLSPGGIWIRKCNQPEIFPLSFPFLSDLFQKFPLENQTLIKKELSSLNSEQYFQRLLFERILPFSFSLNEQFINLYFICLRDSMGIKRIQQYKCKNSHGYILYKPARLEIISFSSKSQFLRIILTRPDLLGIFDFTLAGLLDSIVFIEDKIL